MRHCFYLNVYILNRLQIPLYYNSSISKPVGKERAQVTMRTATTLTHATVTPAGTSIRISVCLQYPFLALCQRHRSNFFN